MPRMTLARIALLLINNGQQNGLLGIIRGGLEGLLLESIPPFPPNPQQVDSWLGPSPPTDENLNPSAQDPEIQGGREETFTRRAGTLIYSNSNSNRTSKGY